MTYKEESYVLDNIKLIAKETHENNIMLQHIYSLIDSVLINHKNDEQNAFEQNVVANLVSELLHNMIVLIDNGHGANIPGFIPAYHSRLYGFSIRGVLYDKLLLDMLDDE